MMEPIYYATEDLSDIDPNRRYIISLGNRIANIYRTYDNGQGDDYIMSILIMEDLSSNLDTDIYTARGLDGYNKLRALALKFVDPEGRFKDDDNSDTVAKSHSK